MNRIVIMALLLICYQLCQAQESTRQLHKLNYIDSIQSAQQVTDLLLHIDNRYKDFQLDSLLRYTEKDCKKMSDSLNVQPWAKADFDNNGFTDLLVLGIGDFHHIICILDMGNHYETKSITNGVFQDCTFPIVKNNKIRYFFQEEYDSDNPDKRRKLLQATLIYKYGDFIEENKAPIIYAIQKIEYSTTPCFGFCPVFKLIIHSNKTAHWVATSNNKIKGENVEGDFSAKIPDDTFNNIMNLINYIGFKSLKKSYAVDWTDAQSSTLKITYNNGKVKVIDDYGLIGTHGLSRLYQLLFELREQLEWYK